MERQVHFALKQLNDGLWGFLLLFLLGDALIANWSVNPYFDVFFARVYGPLFYLNHAFVVVFLCAIAIGRILLSKDHDIPRWTLAIFATAAIHEYMLAASDFVIGGLSFATAGMSYSYAIWLGAFVILAFIFCKPYQKKVLIYIAIAFLLIITVSIWYESPTLVGASVLGFSPTANFYSFSTNFWEVFNWVGPCLLWLMPERWMRRRTFV